ncbi:MAG: DUF4234 domain-containing protein [Gammaproteobacteria bacterium]|nr:MAG: DUF4234 domain-containing protein [Gammaproteobacteria bacterium]
MSNENIYSAPQSDVTGVVDKTNEIDTFPRKSAWLVFFLGIPTLGIYSYYWLYTRTKLANSLNTHTVSITIPTMLLILSLVSLAISGLGTVYKDNIVLSVISAVISIAVFVLYIMSAFSLRTVLRNILESSGSSKPDLNGIMVFFFSSIYMQYKINQCIDERNNNPSRETIFRG